MFSLPLYFYTITVGILLVVFILKYRSINLLVLIFGLYFISALGSIYYFHNSIGKVFSNLSLESFVFLLVCLIITIIPIYAYTNKAKKVLLVNYQFAKFINYSIFFFSFFRVLPFIENRFYLAKVFNNQSLSVTTYDSRVDYTAKELYLSWLSRKFYWKNFLLNDLVSTVLLNYFSFAKKVNLWKGTSLLITLLNPIIMVLADGGGSRRSGIVSLVCVKLN